MNAQEIEVEKYILPAHWGSALINADDSGLEDSDIAELYEFLNRDYMQGMSCVGWTEEEPYFTHSNNAGTLACDVTEFHFVKY
jgi:hypothetical protein